MIRYVLTFLSVVFLCTSSKAQNKNIQLLGKKTYTNVTLHGSLSDVWGYVDSLGNEYAIVGLQKGISIVDVTDPSNLTEVFYVSGPSSIWRDIKTWDKHAYITNETSGGLTIIDMSALPGTITSSDVYYYTGSSYPFSRAHNLYIDEGGIAYIFGANYSNKGAIFLDLNNNPKIPVEAGIYDSLYLHDGMVRGDTLWGAAVYAGSFLAIDVSNKANPVVMKSHYTSGFFAHNCWISDDGRTLFTTDEISGGAIGSYDVSTLSNIDELDLIWSNPGSGVIPHNTHVKDNFLVTSYYRDGITVVDATQPDRMVQVGNYDTSPLLSGNGFNGSWGVYPFLPSGKVIATDIENGLFVLGVNYTQGVYLQGNTKKFSDSSKVVLTRITSLTTGDTLFSNLNGYYKESYADSGFQRFAVYKAGYLPDTIDINLVSGQMHNVDIYLRNETPFKITGRIKNKSDQTGIAFADVYLQGKDVKYRAVADTTGYFEIDSVYEGPYEFTAGKWSYESNCLNLSVKSGDSIIIDLKKGISDDFTFDNNWTSILNGTSGKWEIDRLHYGLQVKSIDFPVSDVINDCSDFAYITGARTGLDHDVDGGWNWLISPQIDASSLQFPVVSFSYWFRNNAATGQDDSLMFYMSSASDTILLFKVYNAINLIQSQWIDTVISISGLGLNLNSIRFLVKTGDFNGDDLLEAGIDNFKIINGPDGITEIVEKQNMLEVYPNPFSDKISYRLPDNIMPVSYSICDAIGRTIAQGNLYSNKGEIRSEKSWKAGILILKITDEHGNIHVARIMKSGL